MKRLSFLLLLLIFPLVEGCKNAPTSASNNSGFSEATVHAPWAARYGLAGTVFNNNMWVIGGSSGSGGVTNYYGDVWESSNGKNWTQTASPAFGGRYEPQVVSFNNQLFLIGGNASGILKNDVWSSPDGITWTQILANNSAINKNVVGGTQFCPRQDFNAVVYNNLIWVIGGTDNASNGIPTSPSSPEGLNDVWSSPDGVTWTQVLTNVSTITPATATTQFTGRWGAAAVSFNNNIYVMCGHYSGNGVNTVAPDIWTTANGSTWTNVPSHFGSVYYHQLVVNNNQMWFSCGYAPFDGGPFNVISESTTWSSWTNTPNIPFDGRFGHLSLAFSGQIWVMGGCNNINSLTYYNDVWKK